MSEEIHIDSEVHTLPPNNPCPPMPDYFQVDGLTIAGRYCGQELGFTISYAEMVDGIASAKFAERLEALRLALWLGAHWTNDHLRVADLRNTANG